MRIEIREVKIYKFDELSDEAKNKVIMELYPDYEWWDGIDDELEGLGLRLTEFDLDRRLCCKLKVLKNLHHTAEQILLNHGKTCETYILADQYINNVIDDAEFLSDLQNEYAYMLQREYDYLCSEEYVKELCEANEFEFTEAGRLI